MKTRSLLLTMLLFASTVLYCAGQPGPEGDYKDRIAVDILPVLNSSASNGFLYTRKMGNIGLRVRLDGNFSLGDSEFGDTLTLDRNSYYINPNIGLQWPRGTEKLRLLYGIDFSWAYARSEIEYVDSEGHILIKDTHSMGFKPFVGFSYNFGKRWDISLESSAFMGYAFTQDDVTNTVSKQYIFDILTGFRLFLGYNF